MRTKKFIKTIFGLAVASVMALSMAGCSAAASGNASGGASSGTITVVWYPNESAKDFDAARSEVEKLIGQATGKKVVEKTTTDYTIAIQALADGSAQVCFMGALGYIQAQQKNSAVKVLMVNTGASGTLDDAYYWSTICVNQADADKYKDASGNYSVANIQGKKMSFVSNSSTSGFMIPANYIITNFKSQSKWSGLNTDALTEGGSDKFFSQVLFGGSHQGSAVNMLSGKADVAAFDDTDLAPYVQLASGNAMTSGAVYKVKDGANAPFDTVIGKQFVVLAANKVLNAPFAYNSQTLSADDVKKIQTLFTSDTVANDQLIFYPSGSKTTGFFEKTKKEHMVTVDDSWFDPIRNLLK